jgi:hypothetical protein
MLSHTPNIFSDQIKGFSKVNSGAEIQMAERIIKMYNWPAHHFAVLDWVMEWGQWADA